MDSLRSEKAPYVVGLLLTLLGWHVAQLTNDIGSTRSVLYAMERDYDANTVVFTIHNVSRSKSVANAKFALSCADAANCMVRDSAQFVIHPPTFSEERDLIRSTQQVEFTTTLAAGGKIGLRVRLQDGEAPPKFYYLPDAAKPVDIYVLDGGTVRGFVVENYFEIVLVSFLAVLAALVGLIVRFVVSGRRGGESNSAGPAVPPLPAVSPLPAAPPLPIVPPLPELPLPPPTPPITGGPRK